MPRPREPYGSRGFVGYPIVAQSSRPKPVLRDASQQLDASCRRRTHLGQAGIPSCPMALGTCPNRDAAIMSAMRKRAAWLNILALLSLVLTNIPASVTASSPPRPPSCNMPCCVAKEPVVSTCHKGEVSQASHAKCHGASRAAQPKPTKKAACKCSLKSAPTPEPPSATLVSAAHPTFPILVAILVHHLEYKPSELARVSQPGITGTDAGPPNPGPQYAFLGRAPPTH